MPGAKHHHRSRTRVVRPIEGNCTTLIKKWAGNKDSLLLIKMLEIKLFVML